MINKKPTTKEIKTDLEKCIQHILSETAEHTRERIIRRIGRIHGKYEEKPIKPKTSPEKRVPRKLRRSGIKYDSGPGNDGGKKPKSEQQLRLTAAVKFLINNYNKNDQQLKQSVHDFPYKNELYLVVDHMIATALGGWHYNGAQLVNETGHIANKVHWILEDGHLIPHNKKKIEHNMNFLLTLRELSHGN